MSTPSSKRTTSKKPTKSESKPIRQSMRKPQENEQFELTQITPLTDRQADFFDSFNDGKHIIGYGSAGTGKAQPLHSKILTPSGWKTMGDIKIGTEILTPCGERSTVVGVFPQGFKDIYTITFSDGAKTECCLDHLWECNVPKDMYNGGNSKQILSTGQIIDWLDHKKTYTSKFAVANLSIDMIEPVELPEQQLTINPYLLGALIGDGSLVNLVMFTSIDQHIIDKIRLIIRDDYHLVNRIVKGIPTIDYCLTPIKRNSNNRENWYTRCLKELNLFGTRSNTKFIPTEYKNGSIDQRLDLIRGLFDTDGTVGKNGDISYSTSSYVLAKDVQSIIWSIGGKCSISVRHPFYRNKKGEKIQGLISYNLQISYKSPRELFTLPRKLERCKELYQSKQLRRRIKSVNLTSHQYAQCIMIDHPKHLYITDDYIITHNTIVALYLSIKYVLETKKAKRVIILRSPLSVNNQGFLPGTLEEKEAVYERPYIDIVNWLTNNNEGYQKMKDAGIIQFQTTSYIRGLTWDDAIIIADETQNMLWDEINTIVTRKGVNSRLILIGDLKQNDLAVVAKRNQKTGMEKLLLVAKMLKDVDMIKFLPEDIVRDEFVKEWIIACEQFEDVV